MTQRWKKGSVPFSREQPQHYKLDGNNRLRFLMDLDDPERRINSVQVLLEALTRKAAA